jgi:GNAT superfamily N-acetyltransferase
MAPSDAAALTIDPLATSDLGAALALSAEAGWNQVEADWRLLLRLGHGFAARDGGRVVATALALPYPPSFGWVSMVLVHGPYRRRGLATRLVERATAALTAAGLVPVLDATPAGAEVYGRMGFRPLRRLMRWRGDGSGAATGPLDAGAAERARALDGVAFGADRGAILGDLAGRPAPFAAITPDASGHVFSRRGRTATQLGPLVARDEDSAVALLTAGIRTLAGHVLVDVPQDATAVTACVQKHGFVPERPYIRMALDADEIAGEAALVHAIAGPELG